MRPRAFGRKDSRHWLSGGVASVLTALIGVTLLRFPIGGSVTRLSFDLPFVLRSDLSVTNVAIVYMDEVSHEELKQPMMAPWDRSLHARLTEQLTAQGAKAIVFDILFTEPSANAEADAQFARAIKESGRVILCGNLNLLGDTSSTSLPIYNYTAAHKSEPYREEYPYEPFRAGAVAWGNANLKNDPDYGIRSFYPVPQEVSIPWLPAAVAKFAGAPESAVRSDASESRWLNYYGPPRSIPSVSYFLATLPGGVTPGYFKDKIVFVGAQLSADFSGKGKDEFLTPYAYWGKGFAPGVEIHATAALNLLRHDWLNRLPPVLELLVVLLAAILAGYGLIRARPLPAVLITLAGIALVAAAAHLLVWHWNYWFAWLILVCELWVALLCSVVYNSLRLYVEKKLLEQSLAAHLSPALVKRVLSDPSLRRRGGTKQEVSMLFTDIENFSRISEAMRPDDLVNLLNHYFEAALKCIHELDGTVMDLVGDAIFVIWNAPVEQPDHRERACRAALMLRQQLMEFDAAQRGFPLRTRVGLHTGVVCVGNVGSEQRFDYAAVGENTNLAARLEGLNRHLGTAVLATREIQRVVEDKMTTRLIGHFQVKGFVRAIEVHELLGPREMAEPSRPWRGKFAEALQQFRKRQFDAAEKAFRETIQLRRQIEGPPANGDDRSAGDGPSLFYLNRIAELRVSPPPAEWIGEVAMKEK
jgi:adenylate cyclase